MTVLLSIIYQNVTITEMVDRFECDQLTFLTNSSR